MASYESLADFTDLPPGSVIMMVGGCGTGKSYISKQIARMLGLVRVSSDELRAVFSPTNDEADQSVNARIWPEFYRRALSAIARQETVVLDATHSDPRLRQRDVARYVENGARAVVAVHVSSRPEVAAARNTWRRRTVPEAPRLMIAKSVRTHPPSLLEGFDGVVRLMNNNLSYYRRGRS